MPALEHFTQLRPLEVPHTDHGERAAQPTISLRMEQVVTQLAATHNIDLSQKGATLNLDVPEQKQRWMIGNIDGQRVGVSRLKVDEENGLTPELDMVFDVHPAEGWEPVELVHTPAVWQDYTNAATGLPSADTQEDFDFGAFADHWAQQIEEEAQREGQKVEEQKTEPTLAHDEIIFLYGQELHDM